MDYVLVNIQNILKISEIKMQLNDLTIRSISRAYLYLYIFLAYLEVCITVYFTSAIIVIMLR